MPFPSTLSVFNRPATTDRLNSPSHSALHNTVSSAVGQIEQVIGLSTTSVVGSLFYDIRSPDSNGGGHVQTANKGGTGQTSFTKGDLLVATSASVIAKLAVGTVNQVLTADPAQSAGMKWANPTGLYGSASTVTITGSVLVETSIFSTTIPASTLGTSNVIKAVLSIPTFKGSGANSSVMFKAVYGNNVVASTLLGTDLAGLVNGKMEYLLFANGATNVQKGFIDTDMRPKYKLDASANQTTSVVGIWDHKIGTSSVESTATQTFGITARLSNADPTNDIMQVDYITVQRIS